MLNPSQTVASVVLDHSECAEVFRRHRIDFCCRGDASIEAAATERGMDLDGLIQELARAITERRGDPHADPRELATPALVTQIVSRHHRYLRRALPFVQGLATKVARVHGDHNPQLRALEVAVGELSESLLSHLDEEEDTLFPALTANGAGHSSASKLLDSMVAEHLVVAELLERIRADADDFNVPDWACNSYRALFSELRQLEADIFTHVHLENHVLMPRFTAGSTAGEQAVNPRRSSMPMTRELDVRAIPPPKRHPGIIFDAFDALGPGEAFVLVNDHDPKPLLLRFQAERPGRFEWSVLEAGPERFRVELRRRTAEGPRGVAEYLEGDHRRLDAMIPEIEKSVEAGAFREASERFAELSCGLGWHIDVEEKILFPAIEQMTGMSGGGPTFVMRSEHVEIRRLMEATARALEASDAAGAGEAIRGLVETLGAHNMKEEHVLYPMADRAAGDDGARDDLVKRLQAL